MSDRNTSWTTSDFPSNGHDKNPVQDDGQSGNQEGAILQAPETSDSAQEAIASAQPANENPEPMSLDSGNTEEAVLQAPETNGTAEHAMASAQQPNGNPESMSTDQDDRPSDNTEGAILEATEPSSPVEQPIALAQQPNGNPEPMSTDQRRWYSLKQQNRQASISPGQNGYVCVPCDECFDDYIDLVNHESVLHARPYRMPEGSDVYRCVKCDRTHDNISHLIFHQSSCFSAVWAGETEDVPFLDKYKGFDQYLRHAAMHGGTVNCPMKTCGRHQYPYHGDQADHSLLAHMRRLHARSIEKLDKELLERRQVLPESHPSQTNKGRGKFMEISALIN